jgi:hypothetical protein
LAADELELEAQENDDTTNDSFGVGTANGSLKKKKTPGIMN